MPIRRKMILGYSTRNLRVAHEHDDLTYDTIGMSLAPVDAPKPEGRWHSVNESKVVGHGRDAFDAVGYALMHWQLHEEAGFFVESPGGVVRAGETAAAGLPVWFMGVTAVYRVVKVVDGPNRIGFAVGTLPGHPARGEESFVVELRDDDSVVLTVRSFSRHAAWFAKLGGPIGTSIQHRATKRLLAAAGKAATAPELLRPVIR